MFSSRRWAHLDSTLWSAESALVQAPIITTFTSAVDWSHYNLPTTTGHKIYHRISADECGYTHVSVFASTKEMNGSLPAVHLSDVRPLLASSVKPIQP
ncbi:hypothetical protein P691DRAFT_808336 [Macrolepiota fuliginosa MF-IS2]|uniref:Uncharacterized protein n=1 Tax=Macrolepiota fuliginosa MF-IS2 TaxID=1400762 RepID=A0A9P6BY37_9AGAR|nr:hypothetical protein P691DRAFT_808336 [Macrolepiota fuliginosa MF-IS2]